ncbi:hypothetical protein BKI52_23815 [marine bacterium AO1-C]|nr:hypothetical protein BKI52_23815 [marine bacterium AO1-C]
MKSQKTTFQKFASSKLSKKFQSKVYGGGRFCTAHANCMKNALATSLTESWNDESRQELHHNLSTACTEAFGGGCLAELYEAAEKQKN